MRNILILIIISANLISGCNTNKTKETSATSLMEKIETSQVYGDSVRMINDSIYKVTGTYYSTQLNTYGEELGVPIANTTNYFKAVVIEGFDVKNDTALITSRFIINNDNEVAVFSSKNSFLNFMDSVGYSLDSEKSNGLYKTNYRFRSKDSLNK